MYYPEYPSIVVFVQCMSVCWVILLAIGICVLPGWFIAKRLTDDRDIAFLISVFLSLVIVFFASMAAYIAGINQLVAGLTVFAVAGWSLAGVTKSSSTEARFPADLALIWLTVAMLVAAMQAPIFVAGAPDGLWDWCEHWVKSLVFFRHEPLTASLGNVMAARGPLMALVSVICYSLSGTSDYWSFQLVSAVVNTCAVVPWFILCNRLLGFSRPLSLMLAVFFPLVHADIYVSSIFTWPKNMTSGLLFASVVVYSHGLRTNRAVILAIGLIGTSVAFLAHYLAFPYALMLWLHFAIKHFRSAEHLRIGALALLGSATIVSTWFFPCFYHIGISQSLRSNTTFNGYQTTNESVDYKRVVVFNTLATLLPHSILDGLGVSKWAPEPTELMQWYAVVRNDGSGLKTEVDRKLEQPRYASGIWGGFGDLGAAAVVIVLLSWAIGLTRPHLKEELYFGKAFWLCSCTLGLVANISTHTWFQSVGVSGSNLHVYTLAFLLLLAALIRGLPRGLACCITAAVAASGYAGLLKRIWIQSYRLTSDLYLTPDETVYAWHLSNAKFKLDYGALYLSDYMGPGIHVIVVVLLTLSVVCLWLAMRWPDSSSSQIFID